MKNAIVNNFVDKLGDEQKIIEQFGQIGHVS